jgi:indole-3-glycerol phosphate synthase
MSVFLARVVEQKRSAVAQRKQQIPLAELEDRAARVSVRPFRPAIRGGDRIIAEIKRKSPSVPAFKQNGPVEDLARTYHANGAAAISIVTDAEHFGTCLADVALVREAVPLPVLVKDFVIDGYQVVEARAAGADALLLMARILTPAELGALLARVRDQGMSSLVECHDAEDLHKAVAAGATTIGINNRNLRTLTVSLETTRQLAAELPPDACTVSESGIDRRDQIEELSALGIDAFLIGGSLLSADDPGAKLRELGGVRDA